MIEKVLASTVRIDFTTHDTTGALVAPSSAFASDGSDFRIYKDGSASEKMTVNGITVTSPFDSITGKHLIEIDTNNSTGDSGFWASGSEYRVEVNSAKTVASVVQSGVTVGRFRLVSADVLRTLGTNAPADWLDAAAVKADAVTKIQTGLSTYAGGDTSGTTTLLARLTSTRAGLLDNLSNLDVAVSVIQAQITALNNLSAKANWFGYPLLEVPDAGTRAYVFELIVRDDEDKLVNLDSSPTIALTNAAGTDRSVLITTGVANPSTGRYTITITVGTATTNESLKLTATGAIGAETRYASFGTQVVDYDTATLINQILTTLGSPAAGTVSADIAAIPTAAENRVEMDSNSTQLAAIVADTDEVQGKLPTADYLTGTADSGGAAVLNTAYSDQFDAIEAAVDANTGYLTSVLARLGAWTGTGVNTVLGAFKALLSKTATVPSDIGGTFDPAADSTEAIRDRGDAAWKTGSGGGGSGGGSPVFTAVVVARIATGSAAGWPEDLFIGDAYLSANASAQPLFIKDVEDNILSGLGTKLFSDADFVATLRLAPLTDGTRTLDTPPTTIEVKSTDGTGILYNDDTAGAEYFELQIPRAKTLLGVTKTKYSCQFIMNWGVDNTYERTVNLGEIKFLRKNAPGA